MGRTRKKFDIITGWCPHLEGRSNADKMDLLNPILADLNPRVDSGALNENSPALILHAEGEAGIVLRCWVESGDLNLIISCPACHYLTEQDTLQ